MRGTNNDYRYLLKQTDSGYLIIFTDISRDIQNAERILLYSVIISIAGLAAVYVLVYFFSKKVFKPVEESYQKQKRFITDASHELKTPLAIIAANADVIEMEAGESEWSKSIKNQVGRMSSLVENMVEFSDGVRGLTLCHYPLLTWKHAKKNYMIHGHIHNDTQADY